MTNTDRDFAGNGNCTRCLGTGLTGRVNDHHASPYVIVVTTALVSLLVAVLGWVLLEIRDVRENRELTAVAVERTKTREARVQDLQNQIAALRREQDLQDKVIRQGNDWRTLRMMQ